MPLAASAVVAIDCELLTPLIIPVKLLFAPNKSACALISCFGLKLNCVADVLLPPPPCGYKYNVAGSVFA